MSVSENPFLCPSWKRNIFQVSSNSCHLALVVLVARLDGLLPPLLYRVSIIKVEVRHLREGGGAIVHDGAGVVGGAQVVNLVQVISGRFVGYIAF
jgi:hypothetical protein